MSAPPPPHSDGEPAREERKRRARRCQSMSSPNLLVGSSNQCAQQGEDVVAVLCGPSEELIGGDACPAKLNGVL